MGGLSQQRRIAASLLKVGKARVLMDKDHLEDIKGAVTRADIRKMISHGYIKTKREIIKRPNKEKKRSQGPGSRKGIKTSRGSSKRKWINTVRPLRVLLKEIKEQNKIDVKTYRKLYLQIKSGAFRSRSHLRLYLKQRGIISEDRA